MERIYVNYQNLKEFLKEQGINDEDIWRVEIYARSESESEIKKPVIVGTYIELIVYLKNGREKIFYLKVFS